MNDDPFSDFLYPFLEEKSQLSLDDVMQEVAASTVQKAQTLAKLRRAFWDEFSETLTAAGQQMAQAFLNGGKLLTMGNGGSATDAGDFSADFLNPPATFPTLPAISLTNDIGIVTAVGNDVGFANIFLRQIIAYGQQGDICVGFSTSGQSANLIAAFQQAQRGGMLTIGIAGYDGGQMADAGLDYCFIVRSSYVPRIQEVHATIYHTLWHVVQQHLTDADNSVHVTKQS